MPTQQEWRENALTYYPGTKRKQHKPIAVVDIETNGLGGEFIAGAYATELHPGEIHFFTDIEEWVQAFFSKRNRGCVWYAHNGGEYDYKYLLTAIRETRPDMPLTLVSQGKAMRCIGCKIKKGHKVYELRDSYALVPVSLRDFLAAFAPPVFHKGELNFDQEVFDIGNARHRKYLRNDVVGLLLALRQLIDLLGDTFGVPVGWTAGSTALKAWRHTIQPRQVYWRKSRRVEGFCREAYHGGLVTLSSHNYEYDVLCADVNAMYAAAMDEGVPDGMAAWTTEEIADFPAYYRCHVFVPDNTPFTFLPAIHPTRHVLCWPTGEFDAVLTSIEIAEARYRGITVEVIDGYVFEHIVHPFWDFIGACQEMERDASGARKLLVKLLRNSLYGKFGTRPEQYEMRFWNDEDDFTGWEPVLDRETGMFYNLFQHKVEHQLPHIKPEWAAWITARARIMLSQLVYHLGPEHVFYTDTDSVMVRAECESMLPVGRDYGQVKIAKRFKWFRCGGPKNYAAETWEGEYVGACKGIPARVLSGEAHRAALDGSPIAVSFTSQRAARFVIGSHTPYARERTRSISQLDNAIGWELDQGTGLVRPPRFPPE